MRQRFRSHLTYANVMVTILAVVVLGGGSAYATHLVVNSSDVVDDSLQSRDLKDNAGVKSADVVDDTVTGGGLSAADLRANAVGGSEVLSNALTGADIDESSLGEVPSATLGGRGEQSYVSPATCNPESTSFAVCAGGSINIPANTRVLILGQVRAEPDTGNGNGGGICGVASNFGGMVAPSMARVFVNGGQTDVIGISGITAPIGPGGAQLTIECNETADGIRYFDGHVSFVLLSG